jgi:hypothetical protein
MDIFEKLAEEKIIVAMQRGAFRALPGAGKPLPADDLTHVPEELRMAYKVLKNAGYVPPELELRREISTLEMQVNQQIDSTAKKQSLKKLYCLYMRLDVTGSRKANLAIQDEYYQKVLQKMAGT